MNKRKQLIDQILPANKYGCYFRLVEIEDADFIVSLRTEDKLSRYINETSSSIHDQINWLEEYKGREEKGEDFYILCLSQDEKKKYGLVRIYNITEREYECGSWIFRPGIEPHIAVLTDLFVRSIAFETLNFEICKSEVRKKNESVLKYNQSFNPTIISEDDSSYYFELDYRNFKTRRDELFELLL